MPVMNALGMDCGLWRSAKEAQSQSGPWRRRPAGARGRTPDRGGSAELINFRLSSEFAAVFAALPFNAWKTRCYQPDA
jgi:hypothetical protein